MDIKVNRKAFCSYTFKGRERERRVSAEELKNE